MTTATIDKAAPMLRRMVATTPGRATRMLTRMEATLQRDDLHPVERERITAQRDTLVAALHESDRCLRCGRGLEDDQSKADGYGRDCITKIVRAAS